MNQNHLKSIELEELDDVQLIITYFGSYSSNPSRIFHREKMVENASEIDTSRIRAQEGLYSAVNEVQNAWSNRPSWLGGSS